jgi:hypothetical protein
MTRLPGHDADPITEAALKLHADISAERARCLSIVASVRQSILHGGPSLSRAYVIEHLDNIAGMISDD